jgi:DnaJ-class molecular chaperone
MRITSHSCIGPLRRRGRFLWLRRGATIEEMKAAYLYIISKVHPDHGRSNYFAKELNAAKAVLMGE